MNAPEETRQTRTKALPFQGWGIDEHEGIVEGVFAVTGVIDDDGERLLPGAFTRTIAQRKARIPMGMDHRVGFGVTLDMAEISREDLPAEIRAASREAAGGVWAKGQVMMTDDNAQRLGALRSRLATGDVGMSFTFWDVAKRKAGHVTELAEVAVTEWGPIMAPTMAPRNRLARVTRAKASDMGDELDLWDLVETLTAHQKAGKVLSAKNLAALDAAIGELQRIKRAAMGTGEDDDEQASGPPASAKALTLAPPDALAAELSMARLRARLLEV